MPIGIAVSGPESCRLAGAEGRPDDRRRARSASSARCSTRPAAPASRGSGRSPSAYDADRDAAVARAHEQFRWFGLGWKVNADLPDPDGFEAATQFVTPEQVAEQLACGPDVEEHVEKIKPFIDAGFTEIALVQIGAEQQRRSSRGPSASCCPRCARLSAAAGRVRRPRGVCLKERSYCESAGDG